MASDGPEAWTIQEPERDFVLARMVRAINRSVFYSIKYSCSVFTYGTLLCVLSSALDCNYGKSSYIVNPHYLWELVKSFKDCLCGRKASLKVWFHLICKWVFNMSWFLNVSPCCNFYLHISKKMMKLKKKISTYWSQIRELHDFTLNSLLSLFMGTLLDGSSSINS